MADFWTHYYCGRNIIKNDSDLIKDQKIFYLGCQGPDIFFYKKYAVHTTPKNLGELIHKDQTKDVFYEALMYLKSNYSEALLSYIVGWISHYVLDKNIHPYIDSKTNWSHKRLEANIDTYIIDKYLNKPIFRMDSKNILKVTEAHDEIIGIYQSIGENIFNHSLSKEDYIKSLKNFSRFHKIFNQKNKIKRWLILQVGKLMGKNLSIFFYHGPGEIKLPNDIHQVDFIINETVKETSLILEDLEKFLNDTITAEDVLENFKAVNYSGIKY